MDKYTMTRFGKHIALCAVTWLVIAGPRVDALIVGVPTILCAALVLTWIAGDDTTRWSFVRAVPFAGYFLWTSLVAGIDVAYRAISPRMKLDPAFIYFPLTIEAGPARAFFLNAVSLIPGTLSADVEGQGVYIHVIDQNLPNMESLRTLEARVARVFRSDINTNAGEESQSP